MKVDEALDMFGFAKDQSITSTDVNKRYKELMKLVHSDAGGSDFFAKQVNEARSVLKDYTASGGTYQAAGEQDNPVSPDTHPQASKDETQDSKQLEKQYVIRNETALLFIDKALRMVIAVSVLGGGYQALKTGIQAFIDAGA